MIAPKMQGRKEKNGGAHPVYVFFLYVLYYLPWEVVEHRL